MKRDEKTQKLSELKYHGSDWDKEFYKSNVYSETLIEEYLNDLKIIDSDSRKEMEDSILRAAMYYEMIKRSHISNYSSRGQAERKVKAVLKPTEKLMKQLIKLYDEGGVGKGSIIFAARDLISENKYPTRAHKYIDAMLRNGENSNMVDYEGFTAFLEFFKTACERALENGVGKNVAHKGAPIEAWISNLDHDWKTYSPIPLTAGKYHEDIGYNSEAVHIMKKIMDPLDETVTIQTIANKLIEITRKPSK